jgi:hypothetical protein
MTSVRLRRLTPFLSCKRIGVRTAPMALVRLRRLTPFYHAHTFKNNKPLKRLPRGLLQKSIKEKFGMFSYQSYS